MKWFVNYSYLDFEGFHKGIGGLVSDKFGQTQSEEDALTFSSKEEAEEWIKNAASYGWNGDVPVEFTTWSYEEE
ncbi:hypothetical protein [Treponema pedis]|uniref:hypothetical protein n=1 Tax=Treponema pedis TaxID=409322 RepID=UPI0031438406